MIPITLLSAHSPDWSALGTMAFQNHAKYAAIHGHAYRHEIVSASFPYPPAWRKIEIIRSWLDENFGEPGCACVWIDCDAWILTEAPLFAGTILADGEAEGILIAADVNGINTGVFAVTNDIRCRDLIDAAWELREKYKTHQFWEQAAIQEVLADRPDICRVTIIPKRAINSTNEDYEPGDPVYHAAGGGTMEEKLQKLLNKIAPPPADDAPTITGINAVADGDVVTFSVDGSRGRLIAWAMSPIDAVDLSNKLTSAAWRAHYFPPKPEAAK